MTVKLNDRYHSVLSWIYCACLECLNLLLCMCCTFEINYVLCLSVNLKSIKFDLNCYKMEESNQQTNHLTPNKFDYNSILSRDMNVDSLFVLSVEMKDECSCLIVKFECSILLRYNPFQLN